MWGMYDDKRYDYRNWGLALLGVGVVLSFILLGFASQIMLAGVAFVFCSAPIACGGIFFLWMFAIS
jgi:hypothetical protein